MIHYIDLGLYRDIFVFKDNYKALLRNMQLVQFDHTGNFLTSFIIPDYLPLVGDQFIRYPEHNYKSILDKVNKATDNFKYFSIPLDQIIVGFVRTNYKDHNDILLGAFKK